MIVVFDMDGVISSEQVYWDTVSTVIGESWIGPAESIPAISPSLIAHIKSLAINSNWDLAFVVLASILISWSRKYPRDSFLDSRASDHRFAFQSTLDSPGDRRIDPSDIVNTLQSFAAFTGVPLLEAIGAELDRCLASRGDRFAYGGLEYRHLHARCQEIHEEKFADGRGDSTEIPVVEIGRLKELLIGLASATEMQFGIATGRTRTEAARALLHFGLHSLFPADRIVCYDDILDAQRTLAADGIAMSLAKPHPYSILRAAGPSATLAELISKRMDGGLELIYVGDGVSDVLAAKAAGAYSVGVLTGVPDDSASRAAKKSQLLAAGCDRVLASVLDLGRMLDELADTTA